MPSNLSPSRAAVERTREELLRRFERMASSDDVRDLLAAAYAIDVAPLVEALRRAQVELLRARGFQLNSDCAGALNEIEAVLARAAEPQNE